MSKLKSSISRPSKYARIRDRLSQVRRNLKAYPILDRIKAFREGMNRGAERTYGAHWYVFIRIAQILNTTNHAIQGNIGSAIFGFCAIEATLGVFRRSTDASVINLIRYGLSNVSRVGLQREISESLRTKYLDRIAFLDIRSSGIESARTRSKSIRDFLTNSERLLIEGRVSSSEKRGIFERIQREFIFFSTNEQRYVLNRFLSHMNGEQKAAFLGKIILNRALDSDIRTQAVDRLRRIDTPESIRALASLAQDGKVPGSANRVLLSLYLDGRVRVVGDHLEPITNGC